MMCYYEKSGIKLIRTQTDSYETDLLSIGPIVNNNIWIVNNIR